MPRFERLALLIILLFLGVLALRQVGSPDTGFHLATGEYIFEHGFPRHDTFTYTVTDHPYIDTSWAYDALLYLVHSVSGVAGVVLLHVLCVLLTFVVVVRTARLAPGDPVSLVILLLLGVLLSEARLEIRPEIVSYLLLASILFVLQRYAEGASRRLWPLLPLFLVWSNVHAIYVVGWGALACFVVGVSLRRRAVDWRLLAWSGASVLAALVNPYGWKGVAMSLVLGTRLSGNHVFHANIGEYESPFATVTSDQIGFYLVPIITLFVFVGFVTASVPVLWRQRRFSAVFLVAAFLVLALSMARNAPLLAIACLPGAVWALPFNRALAWAGASEGVRRIARPALLGGVLVFTVLFAVRVVTDAYYIDHRRLERFGWTWNKHRLPVETAEYINRADLQGTLLNDLNLGGHLIWTISHPVYVDGRLEVIGETFFEEYKRTFTTAEGFATAVLRHDVRWVAFPYRDKPGMVQILAEAGWRPVHVDGYAAVFVRPDQEAPVDPRVLVSSFPGVDVRRLPGFGEDRLSGAPRWLDGFIRRQVYPVEAYSLGVFHYLLGSWRGLGAYSAQAIQDSQGRYGEIYSNLGSALQSAGRLPEARRSFEIALSETPVFKGTQRANLQALLLDLGRGAGSSPGAR
jgi:hypothetical protein